MSLIRQILQHIDRTIFKKIVHQYELDKYSKGIDSWTHFVNMLFMHLADASSIRVNRNGLRSAPGDLNHLGRKKPPSKSSISYINALRDYKIFEENFYVLLEKL